MKDLMNKTYKLGDKVWIDTAPLVASPVATGHHTLAEVMFAAAKEDPQLYLFTGSSMLYIDKKWLRDGPSVERV